MERKIKFPVPFNIKNTEIVLYTYENEVSSLNSLIQFTFFLYIFFKQTEKELSHYQINSREVGTKKK